MLLDLILSNLSVLYANHNEVDHGFDLLEGAVHYQEVHLMRVESKIGNVIYIEPIWEEFFNFTSVKLHHGFSISFWGSASASNFPQYLRLRRKDFFL